MRFIAAALAAVAAQAAPLPSGQKLSLNWCNASSPAQQFAVAASTGTVTDASGTLCVTQSSPYPAALTMQPCVPGSAAQAWAFNTSSQWPLSFTHTDGSGACTLWNTQGGPGYETVGSTVGVYACSAPTPFDSVFNVGLPFPGALAALYTSPNNKTFSNLCVEAVPLPPAPLGTPAQIAYQQSEMACFYHFNMATMAGTQGCGGGGEPPPISLWSPPSVNTDDWVSAGVALGCKRFIYVAKHGCGFAAWPSAATINGSVYPYSVAFAPNTTDVVSAFVASVKKAGPQYGVGFYYSVGHNAYCEWKNFPQEQYDDLVIQQLTELWSLHGPLAEVWFDGGYPASQAPALRNLFATLQPNVVAFGAAGLCASPSRWAGTESGFAPYPCWSTADSIDAQGAGSADGGLWIPAETDFTMQNGDNWFYNGGAGVRTFQTLQSMYETSSGHNTAIIIDFAPQPNGIIPPQQVATAAALGTFITSCYNSPIVQTSGNASILTLMPSGAVPMDRIVVREDQRLGQIVRGFTITAVLGDGSTAVIEGAGSSIGNKFIVVFAPLTVASLTLNITLLAPAPATAGGPFIADFSAYSCEAAGAAINQKLSEEGFPQPPYVLAALRSREGSVGAAQHADRRQRLR